MSQAAGVLVGMADEAVSHQGSCIAAALDVKGAFDAVR